MSLRFGRALRAKKVSASCWSAVEAAPKQKPVMTPVGATAVSKLKPSYHPRLLDHPMHLPLKLPPDSSHQAFRDETPLFDTNHGYDQGEHNPESEPGRRDVISILCGYLS